VANGLAALRARGAGPQDWVLVHDAARCLVRAEWIDRLIDACAGDAVGGLLAMPLADTLKAESAGRVAETVPREAKWAAQTPQMFRLAMLASALDRPDAKITDEASAIEALGHSPRLVRGELENFKLTYPGDFALAERLLASQGRGAELRAMVPARDFARSRAFYAEIGFEPEFAQSGLAGFRMGSCAFLLQDFHVPAHTENFVMSLVVADLDDFWLRLQRSGVIERYGVRAEEPAVRPWGRRDMTLFDPSGVLWRIAQRLQG
jgi:2-C-methyl-D-erythritol 4-phosphate cytidylyltransferase/2-C-methyl-D-erythritol 4-phosphate cytidylyltransferase/2-C-methyl-D-erythritol 2,4-cyclodiphosphate synthase